MAAEGSRVSHPRAGDAIKRALDVVASTVGLLVLSPVLVCVAVAIRVDLGRPVLFQQKRPGLRGMPFRLIKFRTMREAETGTADADRLTPLGRFLRSTSLDELPELWNVLKGEMSLVGPRPLLMEYLPLYSSEQARRHDVRPGITGWTQVNGRNALSWEAKFQLDIWYVDHRSIWLDLQILLRTLLQVARREGITEPGHATARPFRGAASTSAELK